MKVTLIIILKNKIKNLKIISQRNNILNNDLIIYYIKSILIL